MQTSLGGQAIAVFESFPGSRRNVSTKCICWGLYPPKHGVCSPENWSPRKGLRAQTKWSGGGNLLQFGRAEGTMRQSREERQQESSAVSGRAGGLRKEVLGVMGTTAGTGTEAGAALAGGGATEGAAFPEQIEPQKDRC